MEGTDGTEDVREDEGCDSVLVVPTKLDEEAGAVSVAEVLVLEYKVDPKVKELALAVTVAVIGTVTMIWVVPVSMEAELLVAVTGPSLVELVMLL